MIVFILVVFILGWNWATWIINWGCPILIAAAIWTMKEFGEFLDDSRFKL